MNKFKEMIEKTKRYEGKYICNNIYIIKENIGNYIRLEGFGILNGLRGEPYKRGMYEIIKFNDDGDLIIREYGRKNRSRLPRYKFNQQFMIYDKKEYKNLKK